MLLGDFGVLVGLAENGGENGRRHVLPCVAKDLAGNGADVVIYRVHDLGFIGSCGQRRSAARLVEHVVKVRNLFHRVATLQSLGAERTNVRCHATGLEHFLGEPLPIGLDTALADGYAVVLELLERHAARDGLIVQRECHVAHLRRPLVELPTATHAAEIALDEVGADRGRAVLKCVVLGAVLYGREAHSRGVYDRGGRGRCGDRPEKAALCVQVAQGFELVNVVA